MKNTIFLCAAAALVSGCAVFSESRPDLMHLPRNEISEVYAVAAVPLELAYKNIYDRAHQCWHSRYSGNVDAIPLRQTAGFAQVSFKIPGRFVGSTVTLSSVDLYPESGNSTRLVGRNFSFAGEWNALKLQGWAEGQDNSC